jgi:hypothetical protein
LQNFDNSKPKKYYALQQYIGFLLQKMIKISFYGEACQGNPFIAILLSGNIFLWRPLPTLKCNATTAAKNVTAAYSLTTNHFAAMAAKWCTAF